MSLSVYDAVIDADVSGDPEKLERLLARFDTPERRARARRWAEEYEQRRQKYLAENAAELARWEAEKQAWRDQLLAARDPVKAATPIDNDALLRAQRAGRRE